MSKVSDKTSASPPAEKTAQATKPERSMISKPLKQAKEHLPGPWRVQIDHAGCILCDLCVLGCPFDVLEHKDGQIVSIDAKCTSCEYCVAVCPPDVITIVPNPTAHRGSSTWTSRHRHDLTKQAMKGGKLLISMGADEDHPNYFDRMVLDACQVTNPSIDPLREPMELRTFLGRKPQRLEFSQDNGRIKLETEKHPVRVLNVPIIFAGMSYGAISLNAQTALARAAYECGIMFNTGEGGLHESLKIYGEVAMGQCASGRFGLDIDYLNSVAAIEIKIGQGAKPGIGGHLPGAKVDENISRTRKIPVGSDALSPAPHHDIYSIEDLKQLIFALKEATRYTKPVGVKIAAVHNVAAIASGIAMAGADFITIDGYRGSTGAAPQAIRDHVGIPTELALAAVDDRLTSEGIRNEITLIITGGIRSSADVAKAIALGADVVSVGTAVLIALGCTRIKQCHTNLCPWGIATQNPNLVKRLDPDWGAERVINMMRGWELELKEFLGALGVNAVESLRGNRERLRGINLTSEELDIFGIKHAGS